MPGINGSVTEIGSKVTLPVFVTSNVKGTTSPTALNAAVVVAFTNSIAGNGSVTTEALAGSDATGGRPEPAGGVPSAVAVFVKPPASRSACVVRYGLSATQFAIWVGASAVGVQVTGPTSGSITATGSKVTLPSFSTVKLKITGSPTAPTVATSAAFVNASDGTRSATMSAVSGSELTGGRPKAGSRPPSAVAVFEKPPASISACVVRYGVSATQFATCPGSRTVGVHVTDPTRGSFTETGSNGTLPSLVTTKLKITGSPTAPTVATSADFTRSREGSAGRLKLVGSELFEGSPSPSGSASAPSWEISLTGTPPGVSAVTTAELSNGPRAPGAGVNVTEITCEHVAAEASVAPAQVSLTRVGVNAAAEAKAVARSSLIATLLSGTTPVFSATSVYSKV